MSRQRDHSARDDLALGAAQLLTLPSQQPYYRDDVTPPSTRQSPPGNSTCDENRSPTACRSSVARRLPCSLAVLLAGVLTGHAAEAQTGPDGRRQEPPAAPPGPARPPTRAPEGPDATGPTYRLPLAFAYLLPASVIGIALMLPSPEAYVVGTVGTVGMFSAPPIVHAVYGNGAGAGYAILGTLGCMGAGAIIGAGIMVSTNYRHEACDDGFCDLAWNIGTGGSVGAGVGYLTWGTIDVLLNARSPTETEQAAASSPSRIRVVPTVLPVMGTNRLGNPEPTGLSVGAVGVF